MLEAPKISIEQLAATVSRDYALPFDRIEFLPLGADVNTAVFRATAAGTTYFLKLRRGQFDETSVTLPAFFVRHGITNIIPIVPTQTNALWTRFDNYTVILYPFIAGRDGFGVKLSAEQWREFGAAMKQVHTAPVPADILERIPIEQYSPLGRNTVLALLNRLDSVPANDDVAVELVALLRDKHDAIVDLVHRAETLAHALQAREMPLVVCHSDIHAGNILVTNDDRLFIVDWDAPIRAPKERDLMFFGGSQGFSGHTPQQENELFYAGYGDTDIDFAALAYYRYERIVQDIYSFCDSLLAHVDQGNDRRQSLYYLKGNFDSGGTIDNAYATDQSGTFTA